MDLEQITQQLAQKHGLSLPDFLDHNVESVYASSEPVQLTYFDDVIDYFQKRVLVRHTTDVGEQADSFSSFVRFLAELNPLLEPHNLELIYVREVYHEGQIHEYDEFYLTLAFKAGTEISELKPTQTGLSTSCYPGGLVTVNIDAQRFKSIADNPKLKQVFDVIKLGYQTVQQAGRIKS